MYEFKYHRPGTVRQAANLLLKNEDAKVIAGGHTLIPVMKQRLASPPHLVDLSHIEGLNAIEMKGRSLVIGATARHAEVATSAIVGFVMGGPFNEVFGCGMAPATRRDGISTEMGGLAGAQSLHPDVSRAVTKTTMSKYETSSSPQPVTEPLSTQSRRGKNISRMRRRRSATGRVV